MFMKKLHIKEDRLTYDLRQKTWNKVSEIVRVKTDPKGVGFVVIDRLEIRVRSQICEPVEDQFEKIKY